MNMSELNNLDLKDIANAPAPVRAVILVVVFALVLAAGWFFFLSDSLTQLNAAQQNEQSLRNTYVLKQAQARNYDAYSRRLNDVEQSLAAMLRQLPNRSEMDALLTDINQAGVGHGLDFELFKPGTETLGDFYATLPVAIKVTGSYHDIASFVSDLGRLPRIVTVHDVALNPTTDSRLVLDARIQTYRYLDENELAAVKKQKQEAKK